MTRARRWRWRWRLRAAVAALACLLAAACGEASPPSIFGDEPLSIGVKSDQPGTGYHNPLTQTWSGFDIALGDRLADALTGGDPNRVPVTSANRETELMDGQLDLVIATYSITTARAEDIDFAGPYAKTQQGFLVPTGSGIRTRDDLAGKQVCTWAGTTSEQELKALGVIVLTGNSASYCEAKLRDGHVDAFSTDQLILYGFAERYEDRYQVVPDLVIGPDNRYGIGIAEGHPEDCERVKAFLRDYLIDDDWNLDFSAAFPSVVDSVPDYHSVFKPETVELDTYSCQDDTP